MLQVMHKIKKVLTKCIFNSFWKHNFSTDLTNMPGEGNTKYLSLNCWLTLWVLFPQNIETNSLNLLRAYNKVKPIQVKVLDRPLQRLNYI